MEKKLGEWVKKSLKVSEHWINLNSSRGFGSWFMRSIVDKHIELIMVIGNNDLNQTFICYN